MTIACQDLRRSDQPHIQFCGCDVRWNSHDRFAYAVIFYLLFWQLSLIAAVIFSWRSSALGATAITRMNVAKLPRTG
jgi:hypothetical protein